jgi:hypothetical protein
LMTATAKRSWRMFGSGAMCCKLHLARHVVKLASQHRNASPRIVTSRAR